MGDSVFEKGIDCFDHGIRGRRVMSAGDVVDCMEDDIEDDGCFG